MSHVGMHGLTHLQFYTWIQPEWTSKMGEFLSEGKNHLSNCLVTYFNLIFTLTVKYLPLTLLVEVFRQPKKYSLPIQCSRPLRDSQEPKTKIIFQFLQELFQKIPFLYFFLHKSWIWRTNFAKMALLNPCMKFEFFSAKSILLKHYENGNKKKYS